jgi:hypothetical protein
MFAEMAYKKNIYYRKYAFHAHLKHHGYGEQDNGFADAAGSIVVFPAAHRVFY